MSASSSTNETKPATTTDAPAENKDKALAAQLGEDDEFEDFPAEDWEVENTDLPSGNQHLWEESWDDDDTNDDFFAQLKEEIKKVQGEGKKS
jgi:26 proteasome complex subunit DSS1